MNVSAKAQQLPTTKYNMQRQGDVGYWHIALFDNA